MVLFWRSLTFNLLKRLITLKFPNVESITPEALAQWLQDSTKTPPILLDARSEAEYEISHLWHARRIDPDSPDLSAIADVSFETPLVVYCAVGYRSAAVGSWLLQAGFSRVYNLEGSIFQWVNEGKAVYKDEQKNSGVHPYNWLWGKLLKLQYRGKI
ncbi:rhodanese-like domain-containing protein [Microseira sp. BLCC-F43]|uniref:rhodanese-like domain-containing protein n=1 Tax=Microseira sp. BLCC-F43 TaxID=3153602 RepID=UPI0035B6F9F4